uniref:Uncharacterized protein n=1 Tax=Glossina austeni TaxID=7395 RepID=A0A1A9VXC6_GLOAU
MEGFPTAEATLNNVKQQPKDNVALPRTPTDVNVITKTDANLTESKTNDSNLNAASTSNHQIDAVKTNTTTEIYNRVKANDSKLNKASYTSARPLELINELATQKVENINQLNPLICPSGYTYYEMDCRLIITEKDCNDTLCHPFSYCDELNECVCEKGYMFETNSLSFNNCVPIPQTGNTSDCPESCPEGYQCGDLHQSNARAIKMPYNTSTSTTTTETTLFNLLVNFEDNITESPLCKLQIPSWLNVWCVLITICLLIMIVGFVLMLSHIRYYRQRQLQFNRIPGTPEYYSEHFLDRNHIMVY